MKPREIAHHRLANLRIAASTARDPAGVVAALGAIQAQDYASSLWAIGLRLADAAVADVERAVAARSIVRTWPMRGTLHFVPAPDVRWMLDLLTPRVLAGSVKRQAALELDTTVFARCRQVFQRALAGGRQLTREEMLTTLERGGIPVDPRRGYHILWRLGQEQFLCFGPRAGRQPTFVLLDEWVPESRRLSREESLAELARRYFTSHGPATLKDFVWWSGLKVSDARAAIDFVASELASEVIGGAAHWFPPTTIPAVGNLAELLPAFDEYLLGYQDRTAVLDAAHAPKIVPGGNGIFRPMLMLDGRIAGVWKSTPRKAGLTISVDPFRTLKKTESRPLATAAARYGEFLGLPARLA
jgi:hypothetical protein